MTGPGRLGAVNFKGRDGAWRIMGFESELTENLPVEQREVFYRKQGLTWIEAYNRTQQDMFAGEGVVSAEAAVAYRAGQQDGIGASGLVSSSPLVRELEGFRQTVAAGDLLSEADQKRLETIVTGQGFAHVLPYYPDQPREVLDGLIFLLRFDQEAYTATVQAAREDTAKYIIRQLSNRWTAHELNHFTYPVKLAQVTLGLQLDQLSEPDRKQLQDLLSKGETAEQLFSSIRYILGVFEVFRSGPQSVFFLDAIKYHLDQSESTAFQLLALGEAYQDLDPDIKIFMDSTRKIIEEIQQLKNTVVNWEANTISTLSDDLALAPEVMNMAMTLARDNDGEIAVNVNIPKDLRLRMSRYDLLNFLKVLLDNAFQAAAADRALRVDIDLNQVTENGVERFEIKVRDNGQGMTAEQLAKVREGIQFTTKAQFGSGEGLMGVRNLTQMHEGTMAVDSGLGEGTVFTFTFPVQADIAPEGASSPLALSSELSRGRESLGGIDFTEDNLNLITSGTGMTFRFPYTNQQMEAVAIKGLNPVVFQVAPANLPLLLTPAE